MKARFFVNPLKSVAAAAVFCIFTALCATMIPVGRPGSALFFLVIAILFGYEAVINGMSVSVDETGISRSFFGIRPVTFRWEEIGEIGVCGTKVFNKNHKERTGAVYIYFSPVGLSEQERFDMVLKWPPRKMIYLIYSRQHLEKVQMASGLKVESYNTGDLRI